MGIATSVVSGFIVPLAMQISVVTLVVDDSVVAWVTAEPSTIDATDERKRLPPLL
ncbi:hypothetical protein JG688_00014025 [Phytophthora aleatoria]|uniref:Uncharacterized protein n=1 Tax=Phytophthora aleatoria TaxID=2496075 RepID=A0A8J5IL32_9STRA|nr:hypothetical protein JG688_00014025 [Phytophthora aleatoria]